MTDSLTPFVVEVTYPVTQIAPNHEKRLYFLTIPATILAIYTAFFPNDALFAVVVAGVVFRLTANPPHIGHNGWLSVRGLIIGCAALLAIAIGLVFLIVFVFAPTHKDKDEKPDADDSTADPFDPLKDMNKHILNVLLGMFSLTRY